MNAQGGDGHPPRAADPGGELGPNPSIVLESGREPRAALDYPKSRLKRCSDESLESVITERNVIQSRNYDIMMHFDNSPLMIGVTGNMDLRSEEVRDLKARVRTLFRFLKSSGNAAKRRRDLDELIKLLPSPSPGLPNPYRLGLGSWPSLEETPILIFSSLAPGADSLVAEVALEDEFCGQDFHVIAPLPFPHDIYHLATTFTRGTVRKPEPGDGARVEAYERLLTRVGRHRTFCVRTQEDMKLTPAEHRKRCRSDLKNRQARRERYYAAGEYIVSHVHLLIAIWDHQHDTDNSAGTAAIVHARRSGHRIGLLPSSSGLSQPHGGPIFHLATRREKNNAPSHGPPEHVARFLHPAALTPDLPSEEEELKHQHLALALFTRIARNLEQFNNTACPGTPQGDRELDRQLSWVPAQPQSLPGGSRPRKRFSHLLLTKYCDTGLYESYRRLAVLRRRGADHNRRLNEIGSSTLRVMFGVTLLAAFLTHLFSEWHPQGHVLEGVPNVRPLLGLAGVLLGFLGLAWFWWRRSQRNYDRAHDYRALAEGTRVQLFWNLAGLGKSVPANYMQRQRGELDWIRGAISAASIPLENWRDRFDQLDKPDQVAAMRCVLQNWVAEQADYFTTSVEKHHHLLRFGQKLGGLLALAGLLGFALLVISSFPWPDQPLGWLQDRPWLGSLLAATLAIMCWPISVCRLPHLEKTHSTSLEPFPREPTKRSEHFFRWAHWLLHRVVPTTDRHTWRLHTPSDERANLLLNFACFVVPAGSLALLIATIGALAAEWIPHAPDASIWTSVLLGTSLLLGALCVAWSEKNSDSELAYQYSTMAPMFRTAQQRLQPLVDQLDDAAQSTDEAAYSKALKEIRAILYDIGQEALDENAEWLIMHRARPLEPVMAG